MTENLAVRCFAIAFLVVGVNFIANGVVHDDWRVMLGSTMLGVYTAIAHPWREE